jgi:hypothetical protein
MSRWGAALASAAGAVANVGVQALDRQMQLEQTIAAEKRAGDMKLDLAERMAAAEEMRKNRAGERFTSVVQSKLAEPVPLEAPSVDDTGITRESAVPAAPGKPGADFAQTPEQLDALEQQFKAILANPNATPEQREDAAGVLAALKAQKAKQQDVNAASVAGKTRQRTKLEARDAALEETGTSDLPAYTAGHSAWKDAIGEETNMRKERAASREKQLDRDSLERRTDMTTSQRAEASAAETARKAEADQLRYKAATERVTALAGGKGAKATALMQNYKFLTENMGKTQEEAEKVLFQAKDSSEAEKVFKLLMADKFNELTPESAFEKVRGINSAASSGKDKIREWDPTTGKFK